MLRKYLVKLGPRSRDLPNELVARLNIENALAQCGWKIYGKNGAAALLGIQPTTLASRIQRMGIKKPD